MSSIKNERSRFSTDEFRYDGSVVPVFGTNARYVWKPSTVRTGSLLTQAPWGPTEVSYGHTASGDPAVTALRYGSGISSMITWAIGRRHDGGELIIELPSIDLFEVVRIHPA
ncbi:hypothetical protein [Nocardia fluminea]|uniref:hypothetical protein n=1 Tax=Nocardia fluminea TaxID=134984 RepID=UPI003F4CC5AD